MIREHYNCYMYLRYVCILIKDFSLRLLKGFPKSSGTFTRITPEDGKEYFFGYYDKSPWDISNRYILGLRVDTTLTNTSYDTDAEIFLYDEYEKKLDIVASTSCWNIQQGCMLQWLGPDYKNRIIYNNFENGELCAVILDLKTKEREKLCSSIYTINSSGTIGLTLDFYRLEEMRPGYGYCNKKDQHARERIPNDTCIWKIDIKANSVCSLITYQQLVEISPKPSMKYAKHKVNHLMINPSGNRFMVIHRWQTENKTYSRLLAFDMNGKNVTVVSDDEFVSHCIWKNDVEILGFVNKQHYGKGYYIMNSYTAEYQKTWNLINVDGHPSFDISGDIGITDTYPDKYRLSKLMLIKQNDKVEVLATCFSPYKYSGLYRCDMHPRWSRDFKKICFDSPCEGKRAMYILKIDKEEL